MRSPCSFPPLLAQGILIRHKRPQNFRRPTRPSLVCIISRSISYSLPNGEEFRIGRLAAKIHRPPLGPRRESFLAAQHRESDKSTALKSPTSHLSHSVLINRIRPVSIWSDQHQLDIADEIRLAARIVLGRFNELVLCARSNKSLKSSFPTAPLRLTYASSTAAVNRSNSGPSAVSGARCFIETVCTHFHEPVREAVLYSL